MSTKKITVHKQPQLLSTTPSDNSYKTLSQSELLLKVKMLHEQVLKINKYLTELHRMAIYNWDATDSGNITIELPESKKGFLLDSTIRLRGAWNPLTNSLGLTATDVSKQGWLYKVVTTEDVTLFNIHWKQGDYALYDEDGVLHSVREDLFRTLYSSMDLFAVSEEEPTDPDVTLWYKIISGAETEVVPEDSSADFGLFGEEYTVQLDFGSFADEITETIDGGTW